MDSNYYYLTQTGRDSLGWLGGKSMRRVGLNVFDGFLNNENIEIVNQFIEEIPSMYEKGRQKLLEIKDSYS